MRPLVITNDNCSLAKPLVREGLPELLRLKLLVRGGQPISQNWSTLNLQTLKGKEEFA